MATSQNELLLTCMFYANMLEILLLHMEALNHLAAKVNQHITKVFILKQ